MGFLRNILLAICLWCLSTLALFAQESDKDFLTRTIQDALSGVGRAVSIDGFRGALSSSASFDQMTIADEEGIWMTLTDVTLVWTRSALLRGRLEVDTLSAKSLDLPRLPIAAETNTLPTAEATPFALPDLPVSVNIADFAVDQINLGAPFLGDAVQLSIKAKAQLTDEEGNIDFIAERIDGKRGAFQIQANLARADNVLELLLDLSEQEDGIAARLLNLPGLPSVEMDVKGSGPIDAFASDMRIATDGQERLAGQITIGAQTSRKAAETPDRRIQANIGGDITALLAPRYREFFGADVRLRIDTLLESDGAVDVSDFSITAQAADLKGKVTVNQDSWPTFIDITGSISNPDGTRTLLPVGGEGTTVQGVDLRVAYDAANGEAFDAKFNISDLSMVGIKVAQTQLGFDGILQGNLGSVGQFFADMTFDAQGVELIDPASAEALGSKVTGRANINFIEGQPIRISDLDLVGTDYGLAGRVIINSVEMGVLTRLDTTLRAEDLSRFSALAGREMDGKADLALKGNVTPLSGAFDLNISGSTQDLRLGIAQADAVMQGRTQVTLQALRDETGTFLRDMVLRNDALSLVGAAELRTDASDVSADFELTDVALVVPEYSGPVTVRASARQDPSGWRIDATTDGPYGAVLSAKGLATGPDAALMFSADVPNIEPLASPFVPELNENLDGPVNVSGTLRQSPKGWQLNTQGSGPFQSKVALKGLLNPTLDVEFDVSMPSVTPLVAELEGPLSASGRLMQTQEGYLIETTASGPYDAVVDLSGPLTPALDLDFDVRVPELEPLVPQVSGPLSAQGRLQQTEAGFLLDTTASGPYNARAKINGALTPAIDVRFEASLPNLGAVVPQTNGPAAAQGRLRQTEQGFFIDSTASGPYGARAVVEGLATGPDMQLTFDASVADVSPFASGVSGPATAKGVLRQTPAGIAINTNATGPFATRANVQGVVTGPEAAVDFSLAMPNIGVLVDQVNGPLDLRGSARKEGAAWRLDTSADGPSGTQATVAGLVNEDGTLAINIAGTAPLGLSRPFIAPRNLQGQARFDLALNGPPALSSLSGRIQTSNAALSAPNFRFALTDIVGNVDLGGNRAALDVTANASNGGRLRVGGGVTLTPSLPADISVVLEDIVLIDPRLYRTSVSGAIRVAGPLTGGAQISGQVNVGETNVNVPSTGLTSIGDIPQITHVGASAGVTITRRNAGLTGTDAGSDPAAGGSGPGFGLNLAVNAPNRIFVRGRGLDAELGGGLTLTGSTNRVISAGRFELIRGRLDILGKRFTLEEGTIEFQGDLVPYLRFVSATDTDAGEVRVIVEGEADSPEVTFEATPAAPQDEVLSQLLFGRNISEISAFQALQLASAVATLAGRGGNGIISNLREGFGLDDLDVTTTDDGATALRLGKYLSDNVYTDVTATSDGDAEVSLNLDITPNLTGKATLGVDGESSIGIFFEKDY